MHTLASPLSSPVIASRCWDDLSLKDMERTLRQERFVDAMVLAVRLIHGRVPLALTLADGTVAVSVFCGDDVIYAASFRDTAKGWPTPETGPDGEFLSEGWAQRRRTLRGALGRLFLGPDSLTCSLRDGVWSETAHPLLLQHVRAWLDERLAEGHTPESARMLLGLTLSGESWALVDFNPYGTVALRDR